MKQMTFIFSSPLKYFQTLVADACVEIRKRCVKVTV